MKKMKKIIAVKAKSSLKSKRLLQALLRFANTGEWGFAPGVIEDADRNPLIDITGLDQNNKLIELRRRVVDSLERISKRGGPENFDAEYNQKPLRFSMFSQMGDATADMVPSVAEIEDLPYAIIAVARLSATGRGDSLAHRITRCQRCQVFFLRKIRRRTSFCTMRCRRQSDYINRKEGKRLQTFISLTTADKPLSTHQYYSDIAPELQ